MNGNQVEKESPGMNPTRSPFLSSFKTLDEFEEEEASWLVDKLIPKGQITLIGSDGGTGKTTIWCDLIAARSSGRCCILDPSGFEMEPQRVAFLTTEDSVKKKLKKKLRLAGANMANIITPDFSADKDGVLRGLKFGSHEMEEFIRYFKPALCVFDPVSQTAQTYGTFHDLFSWRAIRKNRESAIFPMKRTTMQSYKRLSCFPLTKTGKYTRKGQAGSGTESTHKKLSRQRQHQRERIAKAGF